MRYEPPQFKETALDSDYVEHHFFFGNLFSTFYCCGTNDIVGDCVDINCHSVRAGQNGF